MWWAASPGKPADKGGIGGGMGTECTGVLGEWASQGHGGRLHTQNTHRLVINTQPPCFGARSAGLLEGPVPAIAGPGSLSALG